MIKVCILHRPQATTGGDWIALQNYTAALSRHGVSIELRPADKPGNLSPFDYVHLWAACSPDWGLPAVKEVVRQDKRLIVTPFWWSRAERQAFYGRAGEDLAPGYTPAVGYILNMADVLFTVTMSEAVECWKLAPRAPVWVVPMGSPDRRPIVEPDDYVLCIGRIEPHKNQYMVARACQELGYALFVIGTPGHKEYWLDIDRKFSFQYWDDADDELRDDLLSTARVHALPSFFENPGLVHGEANAYGVPAVMGGHACEPEYYGPGGIYCDPTNLDDICAALEAAWNRPRGYWADLPTWDDAASKAVEWMQAASRVVSPSRLLMENMREGLELAARAYPADVMGVPI